MCVKSQWAQRALDAGRGCTGRDFRMHPTWKPVVDRIAVVSKKIPLNNPQDCVYTWQAALYGKMNFVMVKLLISGF